MNLITAIEEAFDGVEFSETSLRQFRLTDKFGMSREITDQEWSLAGKQRVDSKWQDIPDSEIEECDCLLAHMESFEFRYFLPAYMRYSVKNVHRPIWETDIIGFTVFSLCPSTDNTALYHYNVSQYSLLNSAQRRIVVEFLKFVSTVADDVQRPLAIKALNSYWIQNESNPGWHLATN